MNFSLKFIILFAFCFLTSFARLPYCNLKEKATNCNETCIELTEKVRFCKAFKLGNVHKRRQKKPFCSSKPFSLAFHSKFQLKNCKEFPLF